MNMDFFKRCLSGGKGFCINRKPRCAAAWCYMRTGSDQLVNTCEQFLNRSFHLDQHLGQCVVFLFCVYFVQV